VSVALYSVGSVSVSLDSVASVALCDRIKPGVNRICAGSLAIGIAVADEIGESVIVRHY